MTADRVRQEQRGLRKVGLLASTALQLIQLYEPWFGKHDIQILYPGEQDQREVMNLIRAVKTKQQQAEQLLAYNRIARDLAAQGAQCLVIACSELSVIGDQLQSSLPIYDASELLAQTIVDKALP